MSNYMANSSISGIMETMDVAAKVGEGEEATAAGAGKSEEEEADHIKPYVSLLRATPKV